MLADKAHPRGAVCLHCAVASERLAPLAAAFTQIAQQLLTFGARLLLPLPAKLRAPRRRQPLELAEVLANAGLFIGRQVLEITPALADQRAALGAQVAPATEAIGGARLLVRIHPRPARGATRESELALRRQ